MNQISVAARAMALFYLFVCSCHKTASCASEDQIFVSVMQQQQQQQQHSDLWNNAILTLFYRTCPWASLVTLIGWCQINRDNYVRVRSWVQRLMSVGGGLGWKGRRRPRRKTLWEGMNSNYLLSVVCGGLLLHTNCVGVLNCVSCFPLFLDTTWN